MSRLRGALASWNSTFEASLRLERYATDPVGRRYRLKARGRGTSDVGQGSIFSVVWLASYVLHVMQFPRELVITVQSLDGGPLPTEQLDPVVTRAVHKYIDASLILDQLETAIRIGSWMADEDEDSRSESDHDVDQSD